MAPLAAMIGPSLTITELPLALSHFIPYTNCVKRAKRRFARFERFGVTTF